MHKKTDNSACGARDLTPRRPSNPPGRREIDYRIGTQSEFLERMLWRVPRQEVPDGDLGPEAYPLQGLRADREGEPTGGLLDAFACSLDVLSFYSERIANEGFLGTASERRSLIELAAAIGYGFAPGVAASNFLAFTVENQDDPYRRVDIEPGVQATSIPQVKDALPQTFETLEGITARGEWNAIRSRSVRDQPLALYQSDDEEDPANGTLYLFDLDNSFDLTDPPPEGLVEISSTTKLAHFHAITPGLDLVARLQQRKLDVLTNTEIEPVLRALPVNEVFVSGLGLALVPGQRVLAIARAGPQGETIAEPFRIETVDEVRDFGLTRLVLAQHGSEPGKVSRPPRYVSPRLKPGFISTQRLALGSANVDKYVRGTAWTGDGLSAFIRTQSWSRAKTMTMLRQKLNPVVGEGGSDAIATGFQVMREDASVFGANAPLFATVSFGQDTAGNPIKTPFDHDWDTNSTTIWVDAKNNLHQANAQVFLEREVKAAQPGGWAILENAKGETLGLQVTNAATQSRSDYTISGKSTGLTLAKADGEALVPPEPSVGSTLNAFTTRDTQVFLGSEALTLGGIPLDPVLQAKLLELDLDSLYLDLERGRPISLTGARADAEGIEGSETAIIREVMHIDGATRLFLETALIYAYERTSLRINANVALASHGEAVEEVLGSGDATAANQTFSLRRVPLTYVAASTASGRASTLKVWVDGVAWSEVPTLFHASPQDAAFETQLGEDNLVTIRFGDGVKGRRLPTGELNITASYRTGTGLDGHVPARTVTQLKTKPLGVRGVTNPSPATGAADPEDLDHARVSAPNTVKTLGRVVSLSDYEDFARNFAGVGKAKAVQLWSGQTKLIHLTIAPETDIELPTDAPLLSTLAVALDLVRDVARPVVIQPYVRVYFRLAARILVASAYRLPDVERDVRATIEAAFAFDQRALGEPVSSAAAIALIQAVPGVVSVDLDGLERLEGDEAIEEGDSPSLSAVLKSASATAPGKRQDGAFAASELVLILPSAIDLKMEYADA
ncbi:MAG: putative baseplate assembly protein [Pseudomonadota bacterium]